MVELVYTGDERDIILESPCQMKTDLAAKIIS